MELGENNIYGGGCWPGYLENIIDGDSVVVRKYDLVNANYNDWIYVKVFFYL